MEEWKTVDVFEQEATHDGKFKLPVDGYLLMKIINHMAAESDEDLEEMENPKRLAVRIIIETRELPPKQP